MAHLLTLLVLWISTYKLFVSDTANELGDGILQAVAASMRLGGRSVTPDIGAPNGWLQ